ncbi:hypothetical protein ACFLTQ_00180 [Chloroflexota bacterium]
MTPRGKRAKITSEGRTYIVSRAIESRHIPRTKLAETLQVELKDKGMDVPEVEVLERMISKARNHENPLDEPWSIGCLPQYDIPSDALLIIMNIYERRIKNEGQPFSLVPMSIREALWIARLYKLVKNIDALEFLSVMYKLREVTDEILEETQSSRDRIKRNTRDMDITLIRYLNTGTMDDIVTQFHIINPKATAEDKEILGKKAKKRGFIK